MLLVYCCFIQSVCIILWLCHLLGFTKVTHWDSGRPAAPMLSEQKWLFLNGVRLWKERYNSLSSLSEVAVWRQGVKLWKCSQYIKRLNWKLFFFKVAKIQFTAASVHGSTLLSVCGGCFSKMGACRPPSPICNRLTVNKYLMQAHSKHPNYSIIC